MSWLSRRIWPRWVDICLLLTLVPIAAAIFWPLPQTYEVPRAHVVRVKTDMRSLATSIEAYLQDNGKYPPMRSFLSDSRSTDILVTAGAAELFQLETGSGTIAGLTTPIAYTTTMFTDAFCPETKRTFAYYTTTGTWILLSPGPDRHYDIRNPSQFFNGSSDQPTSDILPLTYDSTNGPISEGDIWRVHQ